MKTLRQGRDRAEATPARAAAVRRYVAAASAARTADEGMAPALALLVAYLLAIPIGWNREREERSAGLRTFPLVAVAACGFIQAAETITADSPEAMARIIEGLITGMGFIGGGAILRQENSVKGTATAASGVAASPSTSISTKKRSATVIRCARH